MLDLTLEIEKLKTTYTEFKEYILACVDLYKNTDNQAWRDEFEDIHSSEHYLQMCIKVWIDLDPNDMGDISLTGEQRVLVTQLLVDALVYLLESKDLDNIYLCYRICAWGLPGWYTETERITAVNRINDTKNKVFEDATLKAAFSSYNPKIKSIPVETT